MRISPQVTFEEAISLTQDLLTQMETHSIEDSAIADAIAQLVSSQNGARGFFVTYLTDERPLADTPSQAVLDALKSAPEQVTELLVKNLAMSSAMAVAHRRRQDEHLAQGSDRVRSRTQHLMQRLALPQIPQRIHLLMQSLSGESEEYQLFLNRWGYDSEQRQAIREALEALQSN